MKKEPKRCSWAGDDPLMVAYHDKEWGVAVHDDRLLFEFLILEGAQAGLSWQTVLRKRENYRAAFRGFDIASVSRMTARDVERLLLNEGIIRNRAKIASTIANAKLVLEVAKEFGSFDAYIWQFTGGRTLQNMLGPRTAIPATSPESDAMSRDLKKRGFSFVGSTICYAFMQAVGMVNDHRTDCFRHQALSTRGRHMR